jgi:phosphatidylglycerol:prolipoprotein diacylglycerol transferase
MHPLFIEIGPLKIYWFGVMMALGFLSGLGTWVWLGRREGRDFAFCSDLLLWIMVGGIVGARLAYVLANLETFLNDPMAVFFVHQGGLVYYGGFVGGTLGLAAFARRRGVSLTSLMDLVVTAIPLAHALGRVGCFLNGCCHGRLSDVAWAVRYPAESIPWWQQVEEFLVSRGTGRALPVHPTQLYEAAFNLALYGILVVLYRRRRFRGQVACWYLLTYPVERFCVEFLRGDARVRLGGLTSAQWVSMGLFILGYVLLKCFRRGTADAGTRE